MSSSGTLHHRTGTAQALVHWAGITNSTDLLDLLQARRERDPATSSRSSSAPVPGPPPPPLGVLDDQGHSARGFLGGVVFDHPIEGAHNLAPRPQRPPCRRCRARSRRPLRRFPPPGVVPPSRPSLPPASFFLGLPGPAGEIRDQLDEAHRHQPWLAPRAAEWDLRALAPVVLEHWSRVRTTSAGVSSRSGPALRMLGAAGPAAPSWADAGTTSAGPLASGGPRGAARASRSPSPFRAGACSRRIVGNRGAAEPLRQHRLDRRELGPPPHRSCRTASPVWLSRFEDCSTSAVRLPPHRSAELLARARA